MVLSSLVTAGLGIASKGLGLSSPPEGGGASTGGIDIGGMLGGSRQKTEQAQGQQQGYSGNNPIVQVSQLPEGTKVEKQLKLTAYEQINEQLVGENNQANAEKKSKKKSGIFSMVAGAALCCTGIGAGAGVGMMANGASSLAVGGKGLDNAVKEQYALVNQEIQRLSAELGQTTAKKLNNTNTPQSFDSQNLYC